MKFLKGIISLAAIGLASAAVAGKVVKDKKDKAELDEFLIPSQDDPIIYHVPKESDEALQKAVQGLENHDPKPITFVFYVPDADAAKKFQEEAADLEMSSSFDSDKSQVEVVYTGSFDSDDLDLLLVQLSEICLHTSATFVEMHE